VLCENVYKILKVEQMLTEREYIPLRLRLPPIIANCSQHRPDNHCEFWESAGYLYGSVSHIQRIQRIAYKTQRTFQYPALVSPRPVRGVRGTLERNSMEKKKKTYLPIRIQPNYDPRVGFNVHVM